MFSNKSDINNILKAIDLLENYIEDQNGEFHLEASAKKENFRTIENKIIELSEKIQSQRDKDMRVFGELMLVCEKVSDGFTSDRITQTTTDHKINYIAKTVNTMAQKLDDSLNKTFEILNQYKEQDFRNQIDIEFFRGGKLQELLIVINGLQEGIVNRVKGSFEFGNSLLEESNQLSETSLKLSSASQKQATIVQDGVEAIESLSTIAKKSEQTINEMENYAQLLQKSSKNSMELVEKTNTSMDTINETTNKVIEAISVISQIAFQTNILSLNAAVEAATAGEAGKGFAVVAQEVRSLASRSAEAANTIGNLMSELKEKTDEGSSASLKTSQEYESLSTNLDSTFNLIQAVVSSTREQQNTIEKIHDSIINIDNVTQENNSVAQHIKEISQKNLQIATQLVQSTHEIKF